MSSDLDLQNKAEHGVEIYCLSTNLKKVDTAKPT